MVTPTRIEKNEPKTILLATHQNQSVVAQVSQGEVNPLAYTAYGYRSGDHRCTRLGFNGELKEAQTHWYLLGNGYRTYNPVLMRFHSPDKLSPFAAGGLNAYTYCVADPVNHRDPTGRFAIPTVLMLAGGGSFTSSTALILGMYASSHSRVQGILTVGMGTAGMLAGLGAAANPASVIAPFLASASMTAGGTAIALGVKAARAATARGSQWFQTVARGATEGPPRYSTLSVRDLPPSYSTVNLGPPPPYSQSIALTPIAPIHSTARGASPQAGRLSQSTRLARDQENLLNQPELHTARMSELPQLQFIDETNSAARTIRRSSS
ncbi:RHS repeat-associated core domain-containing protein [Pseudomonas sp. PLMAX]|uniref:RHS repeat-associated core domain-containing protein n=1 Tax=Pseudomonas sp. PLMAX TaxID=2201998 RepID=UPI0038BA5552